MERRPLLGNQPSSSNARRQDFSSDTSEECKSQTSFYFCVFALEFSVKFVATLLELPIIRLVERMVCQHYLGDHHGDIDEEFCKIPAVQEKVALIIGYRRMLDALPAFLTVLFYRSLSNSWGRRPVIMLQSSGRLLAFSSIALCGFLISNAPPELIWLSSLFLSIGGGREPQVAMIYTSFCDVVPEQERTQLLSLVHASEGLAGIISYPISSILMSWHIWAPFVLAIGIIILEYAVLWHMPETSPFVKATEVERHEGNTAQDPQSLVKRCWQGIWTQIDFSSLKVVCGQRSLQIILACFCFKRAAFTGEDFASQYVSEILRRKILETFWLQASNHSGMLLALSIFIPFFTRHLKSPVKDLRVIYSSLVSVTTGFSVLWRGRSMVILCLGSLGCGLGEGLDVGLQSLGAYIVGEAHYATFFALSSMLGVAGEVFGGPLMASMYAIRGKNGEPLGYCFLLSTMMFACILSCIPFINTDKIIE